jgi:hypothetical protein
MEQAIIRVKMLATTVGSVNGWRIDTFHAGQEYDLPYNLARSFVDGGKAQRAGKTDDKAEVGAPENKVAPAQTEKPEPAPAPVHRHHHRRTRQT